MIATMSTKANNNTSNNLNYNTPKTIFWKNTIAIFSLIIGTLSPSLATANQADPFLLQAFEGVWKMERSATTLLSDRVDTLVEDGILRHAPQAKDAPVYLRESYEVGAIEYRRKTYPAITTQWGSFPLLNPDTMRLLEISIPQTRYTILSGEGENIFSSTDWQRYRFLYVFDIGRGRNITNYYPLFAEAYLGERVLGRLPNSQVLNYARVVPAAWDANNNTQAYEVLLYSLERKGITRTLENEVPISFMLTKNPDSPYWTLASASSTPVADELDRKGHYFTGARLSAEEFKSRQQLALAAAQPAKKSKSRTGKKSSNSTQK